MDITSGTGRKATGDQQTTLSTLSFCVYLASSMWLLTYFIFVVALLFGQ